MERWCECGCGEVGSGYGACEDRGCGNVGSVQEVSSQRSATVGFLQSLSWSHGRTFQHYK